MLIMSGENPVLGVGVSKFCARDSVTALGKSVFEVSLCLYLVPLRY